MSAGNTDDIVQEEILQAALRLYRKFGPGKVTMDEVAIATGRSRTSLYYYYKSHDEIFQAVLDSIVNDVIKEMSSRITDAATLSDKIFAFCMAKIKTSADWKKVFNASWPSMDPEEQSKQIKAINPLHKKMLYREGIVLKEIVSDAMNRKQIRTISAADQDMLAFMISSSIRGLRNEIYEQHDPHNMKAALQLLTDVVVKWLES